MKRVVVGCSLLLACGSEEPEGPIAAVDAGRKLFSDPGFSQSQFNVFSCSSCHSTDPPAPDGPILPGYSLANSAFRSSFWGGYERSLLDAVSFCQVYFMRGDPVDPADEKSRALYELLVEISPDRPSPALPMTVVPNITRVERGDATRGRAVWDQACRACHGEPHTGRGRLSELVSIVPEASITFAQQIGVDADLVLTEKVRHGQFYGVGGNMPLYSLEAMSNEQLGDLLGFLAR